MQAEAPGGGLTASSESPQLRVGAMLPDLGPAHLARPRHIARSACRAARAPRSKRRDHRRCPARRSRQLRGQGGESGASARG